MNIVKKHTAKDGSQRLEFFIEKISKSDRLKRAQAQGRAEEKSATLPSNQAEPSSNATQTRGPTEQRDIKPTLTHNRPSTSRRPPALPSSPQSLRTRVERRQETAHLFNVSPEPIESPTTSSTTPTVPLALPPAVTPVASVDPHALFSAFTRWLAERQDTGGPHLPAEMLAPEGAGDAAESASMEIDLGEETSSIDATAIPDAVAPVDQPTSSVDAQIQARFATLSEDRKKQLLAWFAKSEERRSRSASADSDKGEEQYVVESIMDKRTNRDGEVEYLIKWEGYAKPTWEAEANTACPDLIEEFESRNECRRRGRPRKRNDAPVVPQRPKKSFKGEGTLMKELNRLMTNNQRTIAGRTRSALRSPREKRSKMQTRFSLQL